MRGVVEGGVESRNEERIGCQHNERRHDSSSAAANGKDWGVGGSRLKGETRGQTNAGAAQATAFFSFSFCVAGVAEDGRITHGPKVRPPSAK